MEYFRVSLVASACKRRGRGTPNGRKGSAPPFEIEIVTLYTNHVNMTAYRSNRVPVALHVCSKCDGTVAPASATAQHTIFDNAGRG